MGALVFINFRGQDQGGGFALLLDRALTDAFGPDSVFFSSRSIPPGADFKVEIVKALRHCTVLLAVIGRYWLQYGDLAGPRLNLEAILTELATGNGDAVPGLDSAGLDWVHLEIANALRRGITVIPVLVEGTAMPLESVLPPDIAQLSRCQYLRLHHRSAPADLAAIIEALRRLEPNLGNGSDDRQEAPPAPERLYGLRPLGTSLTHIGLISGGILGVTSRDIWVNSENTDMEMSRFNDFSVSGIIRYWGSRRDESGRVVADLIGNSLAMETGPRTPVAPASVFATGSGALAASHNVKHIIHVAAVSGEPGAGFRQVRRLDACVANVLAKADELAARNPGVDSILLPLLGTGVGGGDTRETAATMVGAVLAYLRAHPRTRLRRISLLGYSLREVALLAEALNESGRLVPLWPATG